MTDTSGRHCRSDVQVAADSTDRIKRHQLPCQDGCGRERGCLNFLSSGWQCQPVRLQPARPAEPAATCGRLGPESLRPPQAAGGRQRRGLHRRHQPQPSLFIALVRPPQPAARSAGQRLARHPRSAARAGGGRAGRQLRRDVAVAAMPRGPGLAPAPAVVSPGGRVVQMRPAGPTRAPTASTGRCSWPSTHCGARPI